MQKITVKNITEGGMILSPELNLKAGESMSFNVVEYNKIALTANAFHTAKMVEIVVKEDNSVEGNAGSAVSVETAEAKAKIKSQLAELQKEFKHPKTDAARKEQIGLEVAELKEQAAKLK